MLRRALGFSDSWLSGLNAVSLRSLALAELGVNRGL
jgi:hypothetical protein